MPSYVVTGTSRGLGLHEFIAGHTHKNVHVIEADSKDARALRVNLKNAADTVSKITGGTLDVLINNAALMDYERVDLTLDAFPDAETLEADLMLFFQTNTIGPIHTINAFLPLLLAGTTKKCLTISTTAGSPKVANATNFTTYGGYGISKAALNLAIAKYASRFRDDGVVFLAVTPGMVKTMPGTEEEVNKALEPLVEKFRKRYPHFEGPITVERSVRDILVLLDRAGIADSGKFTHRDGRDGDSI
ncbi:short-chain dehydrogenases/reductase [Irpex rosettiformis]|uniref:Short-chain dehydrogenases/reductase n=1 Tax=Irpex rosettiformis TaxID=378272 RepID=A0ACB8U3I3_9APHY|nr:short-chain dehydrogenases/reductase [Irpex rosettiformis]